MLAKDGVRREYYYHALADKALVQCFLGQYEAALSTIDQALALDLLQARLDQDASETDLRFTLATCLLHLERYEDAVAAYEQVLADDSYLPDERGLKAARRGQQSDWMNL